MQPGPIPGLAFSCERGISRILTGKWYTAVHVCSGVPLDTPLAYEWTDIAVGDFRMFW